MSAETDPEKCSVASTLMKAGVALRFWPGDPAPFYPGLKLGLFFAF